MAEGNGFGNLAGTPVQGASGNKIENDAKDKAVAAADTCSPPKKPTVGPPVVDPAMIKAAAQAARAAVQDNSVAMEAEETEEEEDEEAVDLVEEVDEFDEEGKALRFTAYVPNYLAAREESKRLYEERKADCTNPILCESVADASGQKWGLRIYPNGLIRPDGPTADWGRYLSVYLEIREKELLSPTKKLTRNYRLRVVKHKLPGGVKRSRSGRALPLGGAPAKKACNSDTMTFDVDSTDWGFSQLLDLDEIRRDTGFLDEDGGLTIEAELVPAPPKISIIENHSKEETGHVGLENNGATCYLNSLLQTLYMTKSLRLAVYDLDTSTDQRNIGFALELQRLFYKLQTSQSAVSTRPLTTAFGWSHSLLLRQHDVQEMNRELVDKLETRMKTTPLEGTMQRLYTGKMRSYIKCDKVDFTSARDEEFYDIQLDVKNMENVYKAFEKYVEEEKLDGDNQYDAGPEFGKQDATKGIGFLSFPPVLNLHLKRFEFDMHLGTTVKVNDRFEFPTKLDLNKFIYKGDDAPSVDASEAPNYEYVLHSVLVHVGDVNVGHYYAFINDMKEEEPQENGVEMQVPDLAREPQRTPASNANAPTDVSATKGATGAPIPDQEAGRAVRVKVLPPRRHALKRIAGGNSDGLPPGYTSTWLRFDDERVSTASKRLAVQANYGGSQNFSSNAYMLVYVRSSELKSILPEVSDSRVPSTLLERFARDQAEVKAEQEAEELRRITRVLRIVTDQEMRGPTAPSYGRLASNDKRSEDFASMSKCRTVTVGTMDSANDMYAKVGSEIGLPLDSFRLWNCSDKRVEGQLSTRVYEAIPIESANSAKSLLGEPCETGIYPVYVQMLLPALMPTSPLSNGADPDSEMPAADTSSSPKQEDSHDSAVKRVKVQVPKTLDPNVHRLVFLREFRPGAGPGAGPGVNDVIRHIGPMMISDGVDYTFEKLIADWVVPLLRASGSEDDLSDDPDRYLLWELYKPYRIDAVSRDNEMGKGFVEKNKIFSGDIFLVQRLKPSQSVDEAITEPERASVPVERDADGVVSYDIRAAASHRTCEQVVRHANLDFPLSIVERSAPDMKDRIRIKLLRINKEPAITKTIFGALAAAGRINASLTSVDPSHIALYRASSTFRAIQQARPLDLLTDDEDKPAMLHRLVSKWDPTPPSQEDVAPAARENVLFYEVLPCPVKDMSACFEVYLASGDGDIFGAVRTKTWSVLVKAPTDTPCAVDLSDALFTALRRDELVPGHFWTIDGPQQVLIRWIVADEDTGRLVIVEGRDVAPILDLPDLISTREDLRKKGGKPRIIADFVLPHESEVERADFRHNAIGPHWGRLTDCQAREESIASTTCLLALFQHFHSTVPDKGQRAQRFGLPFTLVLNPSDTIRQVLEKIRLRFKIDMVDTAEWQLAVFTKPWKSKTFIMLCEPDKALFPQVLETLPPPETPVDIPQKLYRKNYLRLGIYNPKLPESEKTPSMRPRASSGSRSPVISDGAIGRGPT